MLRSVQSTCTGADLLEATSAKSSVGSSFGKDLVLYCLESGPIIGPSFKLRMALVRHIPNRTSIPICLLSGIVAVHVKQEVGEFI